MSAGPAESPAVSLWPSLAARGDASGGTSPGLGHTREACLGSGGTNSPLSQSLFLPSS